MDDRAKIPEGFESAAAEGHRDEAELHLGEARRLHSSRARLEEG